MRISRSQLKWLTAAIALAVSWGAFRWLPTGSDRSTDINPFLVEGAPDLGWPTIRGQRLDGHSDEIHLADEWPDGGPPMLWRRNLGQGYSSFVAADERVFTQYQTLAGQFVLCLDAKSGSTIWQFRYDDAYDLTGQYPGPRSTPAIHERRIYFTSPDVVIGCLDWDGNQIWSVDLKTRFGSRGTDFGYACSPTIADGKVLLPLGGNGAALVALDERTGEVIWRSGDSSASYVPALPMTVQGRQIVVGYMQHALCGFDLHSGTGLFRVELSRGYDEHSAWPIVRDDLVWIASPFQGGCQLYRVKPNGSPLLELIYECDSMSNDVASSVLVDGYVYGFDLAEAQSKSRRPSRGSFRCIDFLTGEVAWSNGDPKKRPRTDFQSNRDSQTVGHASVIVADEKLILLNDMGDVILAKASPDHYSELGRTRVLDGEIGWASPALHRGRLFLRNQSAAVCVHLGEVDRIDRSVMERARVSNQVSDGDKNGDMNWMGLRPEHTLQAPTARWLWTWWCATGGSIMVAMVAAVLIRRCRPRINWRVWFTTTGFLTCLLTGPLLSRSLGDFIFTWPGCLFLAFQSTIYSADLRRRDHVQSTGLNRFVGFAFLATCCVYFLVCRRESLVTEWVFLCAFIAAIPTSLAGRFVSNRNGPINRLFEAGCFVASLTAYFFGAAAVLWWQYGLPWS